MPPVVAVPPEFPTNRPPADLAPCICGPLVGNYMSNQVEVWHVQADGGSLDLRLTTRTVNHNDPQTTVVTVFDGTNVVGTVTVSYTAAEAAANPLGWEKSADISLGVLPAGKVLRVESRIGGTPQTQTHYWLKFCGARWLALDSPSFKALEEDHAAFRFVVKPGEPLELDLDNTGIPTPAVDFTWRLIDPVGTVVSSGVQPIMPGVEFLLPTPMAGLWTLEMHPVGGEHYLLDKRSGSDRHIYLDWYTSQRGEKVVEIELNGRPAVGVPFEVTMLRRRPMGTSWTNDVIRQEVLTNGVGRLSGLPNGYYDVVVRPMAPGIGAVPSQLDLILCDNPVTNRFLFQGQGGGQNPAGHDTSGGAVIQTNGESLVVTNLPPDASGGVRITVERPESRWLRYDLDPVSLRDPESRLVYVERFGIASTVGSLAKALPSAVESLLVFIGGPDGITVTNVLGGFAPATATVGWYDRETGERGEASFNAGQDFRFGGTVDVTGLMSLPPQANSQRVVGSGVRFNGPMDLEIAGRRVGRGSEFNWYVRVADSAELPGSGVTDVSIRAALPGGSFIIRGETASTDPTVPTLRPTRLASGVLRLEFQPEPGVEQRIESAAGPDGPWDLVERRSGTFLPEVLEVTPSEAIRLYRVRSNP